MPTESHYRFVIKQKLATSEKSMRQLAEETNINVSTISRILSGKRKATLDHLQVIATNLRIPLSSLLDDERQESNELKACQHVEQIMIEMNLSIEGFDSRKLVGYVKQYEKESVTNEGRKNILNNFMKKLSILEADSKIIDQLEWMFQHFKNRTCNKKDLMLIGSALFYFITSMDLIPDYLFPVGYLDDALAVQFVKQSLTIK